MITPGPGVAYTWSEDGDMRGDPDRRQAVAGSAGISSDWAVAEQVHGTHAVVVGEPGPAGPADVIVTRARQLPLAVFTADCLGVVLQGPGTVAVAHAGWRGLSTGVLDSAIETMTEAGSAPEAAWIGPGIGACCYEVGPEVADLFPDDTATTTWGTTSVNLTDFAARRLDGLRLWTDGRCTSCGGGLSHRRDASPHRMAAVGWVV